VAPGGEDGLIALAFFHAFVMFPKNYFQTMDVFAQNT
jgi:hypothetical protein